MSHLLWVCWQSLKNIHTSYKFISLMYINKPQNLCRKVHEQIQKTNLSKVLSIPKGRKLKKMGQNHSSELFSLCSKTPSLMQFIRAGVTSQACINFIQDRQQLEKSAWLLSEKKIFLAHICSITSAQNVLKQRKSYTIQSDLQSKSSKINSTFQHKSVSHTMHLGFFLH